MNLPERVDSGLMPGHHLVYVVHEGVLSMIGHLPYTHPNGTLNPPDEVQSWAYAIAERLKGRPDSRLAPDAPVGVYSGDTGERL